MITYLPDIPRLFTAIAETIGCFIVIYHVAPKRHLLLKLLISLGGQIALQMLVSTWPIGFWFVGMAVNVFWMLLSIMVISRLSFQSSAFLTCRAFVYSEFFASVSWQIICTLRLEESQYTLLLTIFIYAFFLFIVLILENYINKISNKRLYTSRQAVIAFIIAIMIFLISNVGFILPTTKEISNSYTVFMIRTLVTLFGIILMYVLERQFHEADLKLRLDTMNQILNIQYEQYNAYSEGRELLQTQIHDFKHHIEALKIEPDPKVRENYLKEMQDIITMYGSNIETGNPSLDIILTRKNIFCLENDIQLTTLIDGTLLDFMSTIDIYTLVGNALDNAIESVLKTQDLDKRLIDFRIYEKKGHVIIRIENYSNETLDTKNRFPQSTKKSKDLHGFGLPSIDMISKKYYGTLNIKETNNWFTLSISFK